MGYAHETRSDSIRSSTRFLRHCAAECWALTKSFSNSNKELSSFRQSVLPPTRMWSAVVSYIGILSKWEASRLCNETREGIQHRLRKFEVVPKQLIIDIATSDGFVVVVVARKAPTDRFSGAAVECLFVVWMTNFGALCSISSFYYCPRSLFSLNLILVKKGSA